MIINCNCSTIPIILHLWTNSTTGGPIYHHRPLTGWLLHQSSILFNCYCSGSWQGAYNADSPQSASPALTVCLLALSPSPSPVSSASRSPPSSIAWTRWTLLWSSAGACCCASASSSTALRTPASHALAACGDGGVDCQPSKETSTGVDIARGGVILMRLMLTLIARSLVASEALKCAWYLEDVFGRWLKAVWWCWACVGAVASRQIGHGRWRFFSGTSDGNRFQLWGAIVYCPHNYNTCSMDAKTWKCRRYGLQRRENVGEPACKDVK